MKIDLPNICAQKRFIYEEATKESIDRLKSNLLATSYPPQNEIVESEYSSDHYLLEQNGWKPPHPDIVGAYFRHFQNLFPEYGTDKSLAKLLGLSSDRRIREYKSGDANIPYGIWRKFLIITGRVPQEIIKVLGFLG